MNEQCFDEGTIQSFLDGELAPDLLEKVACHVALCDSCALLLNEAEAESAFAFSILDEGYNLPVPTERIRTNLFQAIEKIEKPRESVWGRIWSFASILTNPSVAAFASLIVVAGVFVIVLNFNQQKEGLQTIANSNQMTIIMDGIQKPEIGITEVPLPASPGFQQANYKPERAKIQRPKTENQRPQPIQLVVKESIDGEETYLKTIATLEDTVKDKKDNVLRASSRVSFERDMAVVDNSIKRMKAEVRKNPKNEAAKQILRSSYQNKIELLNSVSERSELMARLD